VLAAQLIVATVLAWLAVAVVALTLATQLAGWCGWVIVAVTQALTPVLAAATVFATIVGRFDDDWPLVVAGVVTTLGIAIEVAPALRRRPGARNADAPALAVFHGNLLFKNVGDPPGVAAAVLATGADVLALSELHPDQEAAMDAHPLAAKYRHRIGHSSRGADGLAVWSTQPFGEITRAPHLYRDGLMFDLTIGGAPFRVLFAHPSPPTRRRFLRVWVPALRDIDRLGRSVGPPTMVVADLNAARWHPPLRRLLRGGWRDAHEVGGRGLSTSWPTNGSFPVPFVRLDHALLGVGVELVDVRDVAIPGSDHRAFVVTVTLD
jgi:endonuclease/exonuclease/phosphatase (EEP) superfamily protein YafD